MIPVDAIRPVPSDLQSLPNGLVYLGRGTEFKVEENFLGASCSLKTSWLNDKTWNGSNKDQYYAAPWDSDIVKLNLPTVSVVSGIETKSDLPTLNLFGSSPPPEKTWDDFVIAALQGGKSRENAVVDADYILAIKAERQEKPYSYFNVELDPPF